MCLSELFLKNLNENYSTSSILKALESCNRDMEKRYGTFEHEERFEEIFFVQNSDFYEPTSVFTELMDFWETYAEFDGQLTEQEKNIYPILQIIYEADGLWQYLRNQNLLLLLTPPQKQRLLSLCRKIEQIYRAKNIKFFMEEGGELIPRYDMTLDDFEESRNSFHYYAVQNRLIEGMMTESIITVIAGSAGLTPRRIYSFLLKGGDWTTYPIEKLASCYSIILAPDTSAERRGRLRGVK